MTADVQTYRSAATGREWSANEGFYYDCHVVSLAQLLPRRLYAAFLLVAGAPTIRLGWDGLNCRSALDGERARDEILLGAFGVDKHQLPVDADVEEVVRASVRQVGHCVARVDSYYHEHFAEYYRQQHRTNGHKVTVVDFDGRQYVGIDNVGIKTMVLRFDRVLFRAAIHSNLFNVYEKEDTLYQLLAGDRAAEAAADGTVAACERVAVMEYVAGRPGVVASLDDYRARFRADLARDHDDVLRYSQLSNSYTAALTVERSYLALAEAYAITAEPWRECLEDPARFLVALSDAVRSWRMFKMLCAAGQRGGGITPAQLGGSLDRVLHAEQRVSAAVDVGARTRLG